MSARKRQRAAFHSPPPPPPTTPPPSSRLAFVASWGTRGEDDGQFNYPESVAASITGGIYVSDSGNHRIQCFDSNGSFVRKWGTKGRGDGQFIKPSGITIAIVDGMNAAIMNAMLHVPQLSTLPPGLLPICIAYVDDECITVADSDNHRLQVFGMDGTFIRKWGTQGDGDAQFRNPFVCAADSKNGIICVIDANNYRIQAFGFDGTFIRKWTTATAVIGITISSRGFIYASHSSTNSISCYDSTGTVLPPLP